MSDGKDGMLEVDDNFGLDDSAEEDDEFALQEDDGQQVMNFGQDEGQDDNDDEFAQQDNEDEDDNHDFQDDQDDDQDDGQADQYDRQEFQFGSNQQKSAVKNEDLNTKKVENEQFDEALDVEDSNEIESDEEDVEPNNAAQKATSAAQVNQDADEDDQVLPGQYNAANYANLGVSPEVKELFEYIGRYKPQKIDLETTFRPFIPEYMPSVGEVDAFLKMPKPDGNKEDFGIAVLDETCNSTDPSVLEMKYIQLKKTIKKVEMSVRSIENAEKNPKDIQNWITNVEELHKNRPPATVQYSKIMPDFDKLMEEWPPSIEKTLRDVDFPGPEIDVSLDDYAKIMATMLDIPVHKTQNNKGIIEAMHVMFTLYSDFKENQHFQKQQQQQVTQERDGTQDFMPIDH